MYDFFKKIQTQQNIIQNKKQNKKQTEHIRINCVLFVFEKSIPAKDKKVVLQVYI